MGREDCVMYRNLYYIGGDVVSSSLVDDIDLLPGMWEAFMRALQDPDIHMRHEVECKVHGWTSLTVNGVCRKCYEATLDNVERILNSKHVLTSVVKWDTLMGE